LLERRDGADVGRQGPDAWEAAEVPESIANSRPLRRRGRPGLGPPPPDIIAGLRRRPPQEPDATAGATDGAPAPPEGASVGYPLISPVTTRLLSLVQDLKTECLILWKSSASFC
jgi:hypothetical protein